MTLIHRMNRSGLFKIVALVFFFLSCSISLYARPEIMPDRAYAKGERPAAQATDISPVPVPTPDEKAMSYYNSGIAWWIGGMVMSFAVPLVFLFSGFSAFLKKWSLRIGRNWFSTIAVYFILFAFLNFLIDLPIGYFAGFVREHAYGMSEQTLGKWAVDRWKGLLVTMMAGVLFLWVPYLLIKKSPRRWWLYTGLLSIPFLFFVDMISPVFVDPLFNDFHRIENQELEARILRLADRAGIEGGRVYEVNKSIDTNRINAYVTGFAGTRRIVLWDTAIANLSEKELMFVMGHEMGHYVLGHVWKIVIFFSVLVLVTLYAIYRTAEWMLLKFSGRFGFTDLGDIASLPLILFLFSLYGFFVSPVQLVFSRYLEHEADRFGLEITRENHAAATSFSKFVTRDLGNPRPHWLIKIFRAGHPTLAERIEFANEYRPWENQQPLYYEHLFKEPSK